MNNLISLLCENYTTDLIKLSPIFEQYEALDWKEFISETNTYQKNLVFSNTEFELYIITWNKQQGTKIHNHADFGCLMKVLQGKVQETVYNTVDLSVKGKNQYKTNDISYISNKKGFHSIFNNNENNISVTLHLYSPINHKIRFYPE
jgi:cysteine dioxygenase